MNRVNLNTSALMAAILTLAAPAMAAPQMADSIWSGGTILTMNDKAMRAEAVAVADGKIIAVGKSREVMKLKGPATQLVDLKGQTLIPGFVDAHGHIFGGGLQALSANLLAPPDGEVKDIASLQQTLRDWVQKNAAAVEKTQLILGFGYDNAQLKELRHPTKEELDEVSKDIPILIVHQSAHLATANSAMLKVIGYDASTKNPAGGVIQRKPGSTEPNGTIEETAFSSALPAVLGRVGPEGLKTFAREGAKLWARFGYTTAEEGRSTPQIVAVMKQVAAEGGFANDVNTYPDVLVDRAFIKANQSNTYTNRFRVAGAKLTIDGSPQGFTAWRDKPYYKLVGNYPEGYSGYAAASAEDVMGAVQWAAENGIQVITHSNGERASDLLIASHQAAQARFPQAKALRPVLIHGQFLREDQLDSYKSLGVIPSLFPMHTFYWGDWHLDHTVGPQAGLNISPTGWARKRGMIFSSHHDAPVAFPDSMRVLDATVTRRARGSGRIVGPEHRVDVITALKAMTIWPAYHHFEEKTKGSLEVGKLADFALLSKDPTAVKPDTIAEIKVTETIKEGKTIFRLEPGTKKAVAAPDITPLLTAFGGHSGEPGEVCAHDAMFRMTAVMAGGDGKR
ncbi:amidohydrolase [Paucibacter sp. TC2R-5]|uniref:amidohydrolase n=1 Tax=Paucibacter sp. TC2R-5 TaxID=2893555 RepID=UPI0021E37B17|nr:amidohydrolase [Paucibacter sp. TC2R-5]MCV2360439.1 amidohydrolase [Paucibacter sp. TC2R-5]